jgi:hypothetical protein
MNTLSAKVEEFMMTDEREKHWQAVYSTKDDNQMSWYEAYPAFSLELIDRYGGSSVVDVGGGASRLVDALVPQTAPFRSRLSRAPHRRFNLDADPNANRPKCGKFSKAGIRVSASRTGFCCFLSTLVPGNTPSNRRMRRPGS